MSIVYFLRTCSHTSRSSLLYSLYYTPLLPRELTLIGGVPVPLKNDCP